MQTRIEINKLSDIPLYLQLKDSIKNAILEGQFKENDKLPTEEMICSFYNISRPVVRKAYQALIDEGLVVRRQGSGTFVERNILIPNIFFRADFTKALAEYNIEGSSRILSLDIRTKKDVAELRNEQHPTYYLIKRIRYGNSIPLILEEFYFPTDLFPDIKDVITNSVSFTEVLLKRYKTGNIGSNIQINAFAMDEVMSSIFELPAGSAAFKFITYNRFDDGSLCFFKHSYFPGKRYRIDLEIDQ